MGCRFFESGFSKREVGEKGSVEKEGEKECSSAQCEEKALGSASLKRLNGRGDIGRQNAWIEKACALKISLHGVAQLTQGTLPSEGINTPKPKLHREPVDEENVNARGLSSKRFEALKERLAKRGLAKKRELQLLAHPLRGECSSALNNCLVDERYEGIDSLVNIGLAPAQLGASRCHRGEGLMA